LVVAGRHPLALSEKGLGAVQRLHVGITRNALRVFESISLASVGKDSGIAGYTDETTGTYNRRSKSAPPNGQFSRASRLANGDAEGEAMPPRLRGSVCCFSHATAIPQPSDLGLSRVPAQTGTLASAEACGLVHLHIFGERTAEGATWEMKGSGPLSPMMNDYAARTFTRTIRHLHPMQYVSTLTLNTVTTYMYLLINRQPTRNWLQDVIFLKA